MGLRGGGMLITFMDIAPADEAEFNRWYDGEHIAERVGIPGFIAARRFVAAPDAGNPSPKYLAYYEAETLAVLGGEAYRRALNNQTAWSRAVMARFVAPGRIIAAVKASRGQGRGGWTAFVRCAPATGRADALAAWLGGALDRLVAAPGIVGAHFLVNDPALSLPLDADGKPVAGAPPAPTTWILIVEATQADALAATPDERALVAAGAAPGVRSGRFRLMWELARDDLARRA
ncbi:MAG TPA: hypothetical protein VMB81_26130 [Candidatus Sulfotelmatobacter sp.]|nr:hypothetical protein [Candidatus Sulfotelmatobacter sp.]